MTRRSKKLLIMLATATILAGYCSVASAAGTTVASMFGATKCPDELADADTLRSARTTHTPAITYADLTRLCEDDPHAVICAGTPGDRLTFAQVSYIDAQLRSVFRYRSDDATAGRSDYWRNWSICGDCEDYALTLSELLARNGEGGQYMGLQLMFVPILPDDLGDPNKQVAWGAHVTLWVDTSDKGTVEISVGDGGEPTRVVWGYGVRLGMIPMDGSRTPFGFGGAVVHDDVHIISLQ